MGCRFICLAALLAWSALAAADETAKSKNRGPETTIKVGDVSYPMPFEFPSFEELQRGLPKLLARPKQSLHFQCDLINYAMDQPRVFLGGRRAVLLQAQFKCSVTIDQGKEMVVYFDREQLIPWK